MANNYAKALGQVAKESVKDTVGGFAKGIKSAALSEMPGIASMYGFIKNIQDRSDKIAESSVKEQKKTNLISTDMLNQLKYLADMQKKTAMFAEETDREKAQRDKELLDAIKNLKSSDGRGGKDSSEKNDKGFLSSLLDSIFENGGVIRVIKGIAGALGAVAATVVGKKLLGKAIGGAASSAGGTLSKDAAGKILKGVDGASGGARSSAGGTLSKDAAGKILKGVDGASRGARSSAGGTLSKDAAEKILKGVDRAPRGSGSSAGGTLSKDAAGKVLKGAGGIGEKFAKFATKEVAKTGAKLLAKGALRFVPGLGWVLLAADVAEAGNEAYKYFKGKKNSNSPDDFGSFDAGVGDWDGQKPIKKGIFDKKAPRGRRSGVPLDNAKNVDAATFITGKEGRVLKAERDTNKMAIGYGHNITAAEVKAGEIDLGNGNRIKISGKDGEDTTITADQAKLLFDKDIKQYERIVTGAIGQEAYNKLSTNQKTAILSYVYNTGSIPKGFVESIKAGNYASAATSIRNGTSTVNPKKVKNWSDEKLKQVNESLKKRRADEANLFSPENSEKGSIAGDTNKTRDDIKSALTKGAPQSRPTGAPLTPMAVEPSSPSSPSSRPTGVPLTPLSVGPSSPSSRPTGVPLTPLSVGPSSPSSRLTLAKKSIEAADEYVDDGTGRMVLKSELDAIKNKKDSGLKLLNDSVIKSTGITRGISGVSSGTILKPPSETPRPIQVEDKKLNITAEKQLKESKAVVRQTGVVSRATNARLTSSKLTKEQQIIQNANQTFLNNFQSTTARLLNKAIYDSVVVGAYGKKGSKNLVTRQQAEGEMFRGQELSKAIKLNKGTEKLLTNVFGKELGKAYAPMVAQLGTAYLEVGSRYVGREMFKGILGNDKNADALTGQIIGNFARGNKQAATEQLLYGLTGVASGPETIFAKYGFGSSQQGVNFMANYGAAQITAPLAGMMGGKEPTYRGPGGQTYGASQTPVFGAPNQGYGASQTPTFGAPNQRPAYDAMGRAVDNKANPVNPAVVQLAMDGDKAARDSLPQIEKDQWAGLQQAKDQHKTATDNFLKAEAGTDGYRVAQETREQSAIRLQENANDILQAIANKPSGGGGSSGSMPGMSSFMGNMGNFVFDMGVSYVTNKLTKNIKNPYVKAFANYGLSSAANSFIKPMIFGTPAAGATGGASSMFTMQNASDLGSSLMPGSAAGFAGTAGNILASGGYTTAGNFMSGFQSGMNLARGTAEGVGYAASGMGGSLAVGETFGKVFAQASPYLPYTAAILQTLKGDVKGGAITGGLTYLGGIVAPMLGLPPFVGQFVGSLLGSVLGGKKKKPPPPPALYRVLDISGMDLSFQTTWTQGNVSGEFTKFADSTLTALFNAAKVMRQNTGQELPFTHIGLLLHANDGIKLSLHQPGEALNNSNTRWSRGFGSLKDFKAGTGISNMITFMRDCLKETADAKTSEKLDKANKELQSKNISTLTKGVLTELKSGGKYDLTKGLGYENKAAAMGGQKSTSTVRRGSKATGGGITTTSPLAISKLTTTDKTILENNTSRIQQNNSDISKLNNEDKTILENNTSRIQQNNSDISKLNNEIKQLTDQKITPPTTLTVGFLGGFGSIIARSAVAAVAAAKNSEIDTQIKEKQKELEVLAIKNKEASDAMTAITDPQLFIRQNNSNISKLNSEIQQLNTKKTSSTGFGGGGGFLGGIKKLLSSVFGRISDEQNAEIDTQIKEKQKQVEALIIKNREASERIAANAPIASSSIVSNALTIKPLTAAPLTVKSANTAPLTATSANTKPLTATTLTAKPLIATSANTKPLIATSANTKPLIATSANTKPLTATTLTVKSANTKPLTATTLTVKSANTKPLTATTLTATTLTAKPLIATSANTKPLTATTLTVKPLTATQITTKPLIAKSANTIPLTTAPLTTAPTTKPLTTQSMTNTGNQLSETSIASIVIKTMASKMFSDTLRKVGVDLIPVIAQAYKEANNLIPERGKSKEDSPTNAVVAVGGNSRVDNSTTIVNTYRSSMIDPWNMSGMSSSFST
jgi:GH24 family phage-related lysozyme (muramidase)